MLLSSLQIDKKIRMLNFHDRPSLVSLHWVLTETIVKLAEYLFTYLNNANNYWQVCMWTWSMSCADVSRASCALWLSGFCMVARSACTRRGITSSATALHWVISCCCEAWLRLDRPAPPAALISWVAADAACFDACYTHTNTRCLSLSLFTPLQTNIHKKII